MNDPMLSARTQTPETLPENVATALRDDCYAFLLAGGTITLADWQAMTHHTREAMVSAAKTLAEGKALLLARAILLEQVSPSAHVGTAAAQTIENVAARSAGGGGA